MRGGNGPGKLAIAGTLLPWVIGSFTNTPATVAVGLAAQVACLVVGTAVGTITSSAVFPHPGVGLLTALALLILSTTVPGSPARAALHTLTASPAPTGELTYALIGAAVVLVLSTVLAHLALGRRD